MELMKITEVTDQFKVSSRTLRYYEQVGLLQSVRPTLEKYRYYDKENITRLQQIVVLRKMQIPIKDIMHIYENQDIEVLVESFVHRIEDINDEINNLSELKSYLNEFLVAMKDHGITHISALPLLYEKVEEEFMMKNENKSLSMESLSDLSDKLAKPMDIGIIELPSMTVMSSVLVGEVKSNIEAFWDWLSKEQIPFGQPGSRTLFEYQSENEIILIQKMDNINLDCPFHRYEFIGGLFATCSSYCDEDMGALQNRMIQSFDDNPNFEVEFLHNGNLRHNTLVETVYSPENGREKVILYIPVKRRKYDFSDYEEFERINNITTSEIINENPVLREYPVNFHKITPIYEPHYQVLENGEAEFHAWISARMLSTNVSVKIPFRIDIEFLAEKQSEQYLWGTSEGSLWFSHGNCTYTINAQNNSEEALSRHAISFQQPVLANEYVFPGIGDITHDVYHKLTWIVGEKHFAVIIDDEVRFCGTKFPYMDMDMYLQDPQLIKIGSNGQGKKLFRSIRISQLKSSPRINAKHGDLTMTIKQSNNILPKLRNMITSHYGENYWFNGCASYLMECNGETDYDYWFFAGLTGENFAQVYSKNHYRGDGLMDYRLSELEHHFVVEEIFAKCGYDSSFVPLSTILCDREMYLQKLISYIDKGLPVIINDYGKNPHQRFGFGVLVGYEDYGKTLLYMGGDGTEPDRISMEDLLTLDYQNETRHCHGWLFLGEKKEEISLDQIYRNRILTLPELLTFENENYCFGAKAFRAWAESIDNGKYEDMKPENFDDWGMYSIYICNLATNSGGCKSFLEQALKLNPDLTFIAEILSIYVTTGRYWNNDDGDDLEALGGGFNVTLEALQNKERRDKIVAKLDAFALCIDRVVELVNEFIIKERQKI